MIILEISIRCRYDYSDCTCSRFRYLWTPFDGTVRVWTITSGAGGSGCTLKSFRSQRASLGGDAMWQSWCANFPAILASGLGCLITVTGGR